MLGQELANSNSPRSKFLSKFPTQKIEPDFEIHPSSPQPPQGDCKSWDTSFHPFHHAFSILTIHTHGGFQWKPIKSCLSVNYHSNAVRGSRWWEGSTSLHSRNQEPGNQVMGQEWQSRWGQANNSVSTADPGWDPQPSLGTLMVKHHSWKTWTQSLHNSAPKCCRADTAPNLTLNRWDSKPTEPLQISCLRMIWNIRQCRQNWKLGKTPGEMRMIHFMQCVHQAEPSLPAGPSSSWWLRGQTRGGLVSVKQRGSTACLWTPLLTVGLLRSGL